MESIEENGAPVNAPATPYGNQFGLGFGAEKVPHELYGAADKLSQLVVNGYSSQWSDLGDAESIVVQREAIAFCRRALDEIESICDYSALVAADHLRAELTRLEKNVGVRA